MVDQFHCPYLYNNPSHWYILHSRYSFDRLALENGEKVEVALSEVAEAKPKKKDWVVLSLRVVAFLATASATIVMALNKQTKSFVVANVGTTPITATLAAKFNQTPAFVYVS